jgi:hypothetical protein
MPLYTPGATVRVVEQGSPVELTSQRVADDVTAAAGGRSGIVGAGLPPGGAAGTALQKVSSADWDTGWGIGASSAAAGFQTESVSGGMPRPTGHSLVIWSATQTPFNAVPGDVLIEP